MLLVETDLPAAAAAVDMERATVACTEAGASSVIQATDPQEADWLRQARRLALRALERLGTVRMEDVGVPRGRVPELLVAIDRVGRKHGIRIATFGHAGDGNLHPNLVFERDDPRAEELTEAARRRPVPRRDRARRDDHGRARRGLEPAGVARRAGRTRRPAGHAVDQDRARPAGAAQPRQGAVAVAAGGRAILAVDLGTTEVKVGLVGAGRTLARGGSRAPTRSPSTPRPGRPSRIPSAWWAALVAATPASAAMRRVPSRSRRSASWGRGRRSWRSTPAGVATHPAITWMDGRPAAEAGPLEAATGLTGWGLGILPAARWLERHARRGRRPGRAGTSTPGSGRRSG